MQAGGLYADLFTLQAAAYLDPDPTNPTPHPLAAPRQAAQGL
jgi:hypothetical protein